MEALKVNIIDCIISLLSVIYLISSGEIEKSIVIIGAESKIISNIKNKKNRGLNK